jgi:hypothetical protein
MFYEYDNWLKNQNPNNENTENNLPNETTLSMFANSQTSDEEDIIKKYKLYSLKFL